MINHKINYIYDKLRLLNSGLKPYRFYNFLKLKYSFYLSAKSGTNKHKGYPAAMSVEPTTTCNLRCPQCPSGLREFSRDTGDLDPQMFYNIIDQTHKHLSYLTLYFQGEPYINKNFTDIVHYAHKHNIYSITSTNAHVLTPENAEKTVKSGLSKIIISIDGLDQENYEKYRIGGKLKKVLEGTKNLIEARKNLNKRHPYIVWQFIVFKHNEHQMADIKKLAKQYGVDELSIKTAQIYDYDQNNDLMPLDAAFRRYEKIDDKWQIKGTLPNKCWKSWQSCVFTWDGNLVPCCFDKDASYPMGNINSTSFKNIWESAKLNAFRQQILNDRKSIDICKNCSEGMKVFG